MEQFVFRATRVTPQRALIAGWARWLVCFLMMPISIVFHGTFESVTLFVCANVALWLGISFAPPMTEEPAIVTERRCFHESHIRLILSCLVVAGVIAIAAKVV